MYEKKSWRVEDVPLKLCHGMLWASSLGNDSTGSKGFEIDAPNEGRVKLRLEEEGATALQAQLHISHRSVKLVELRMHECVHVALCKCLTSIHHRSNRLDLTLRIANL